MLKCAQMVRRLEVATRSAQRIPPHPAPGLACGRGVAAGGLAMLDGPHALDKGDKRLAERGMVPLLQPGLTRAALHDERLGPMLDARLAAKLTQVWSVIARTALEGSALPTPGLQQDTTPLALAGA